jgi:hypothetical protein
MPTTKSDIPTEGDTVQLTVPEGAVGLTHADVDGTFTVVGSEVTPSGVRLHVVPTGSDAPRYALMNEHVTTTD